MEGNWKEGSRWFGWGRIEYDGVFGCDWNELAESREKEEVSESISNSSSSEVGWGNKDELMDSDDSEIDTDNGVGGGREGREERREEEREGVGISITLHVWR